MVHFTPFRGVRGQSQQNVPWSVDERNRSILIHFSAKKKRLISQESISEQRPLVPLDLRYTLESEA